MVNYYIRIKHHVDLIMGGSSSKPTPSTTLTAVVPTATSSTRSRSPVRTKTRRVRTETETEVESKASIYMNQALDVIVLGASGDLAKKKTYPSLYELFCFNFLPPATKIWGYARSDYELSAFHDRIRPFLLKSKAANPSKIEQFLQLCTYHRGTGYDDVPSWSALGEKLSKDTNRLFYFAIPNTAFGASGKAISESTGMMVDESNGAFNRFVIEKPFGSDSESSEVLAKELTSLFKEHQLYRIDHYLGKDMVSNILSLRLANIFFSSLWNKEHVESVIISWKENIGTMGRGGYFDTSGIIRDVMQNHLLQVLSIVAMEPPESMTATSIRDAKTAVLKCIPPLTSENLVLGQYTRGKIGTNTEEEPGYIEDATVPNDSITPTYCLAEFAINNDRWQGVPFIMKAGKAMDSKHCTVRLQFKNNTESALYGSVSPPRNELVIRIQPDPAIWMKVNTQQPGLESRLMQSELDLTYSEHVGMTGEINAYTRLLLDVLRANQSSFVRSDELKEAWKIFTPVLHQIDSEKIKPITYAAGSRGPAEADDRMKKVYKRSLDYAWDGKQGDEEEKCKQQVKQVASTIRLAAIGKVGKENWKKMSWKEKQNTLENV